MAKTDEGKKRKLEFCVNCPWEGKFVPFEGSCMELADKYKTEEAQMMRILAQAYGLWESFLKPKCQYAKSVSETSGTTAIVCGYKRDSLAQ